MCRGLTLVYRRVVTPYSFSFSRCGYGHIVAHMHDLNQDGRHKPHDARAHAHGGPAELTNDSSSLDSLIHGHAQSTVWNATIHHGLQSSLLPCIFW